MCTLLLASAIARGQAVPRYEPTACAFEGAAALGEQAVCGALVVAEDSGEPESRSLRLAVVVLKSPAADRAPDPIVYLAGGPGGRAIDDVAAWRERAFAARRDIVLVDQRGTGNSAPLCPEAGAQIVQLMARDLTAAEDLAGNVAIAHRCREQLRRNGIDPTRYASAASAADLDALRRALGYGDWNLLGVSYGTRLALTALRDQQTGIRSVVLDSAFPPDADFYANLAAGLGPGLDRLAAECAADRACRVTVGDLAAEYRALENALAQQPLRLQLDGVEQLPDPTFVVNAADLRFLVGEVLSSAGVRPVLPALIHAWRRGETASLATLFKVVAGALASGHDVGKYYAVQCAEEMPFSSARQGPGSEPYTAFQSAASAVCADWNLPAADPRENQPVASTVPTLLLAGGLDSRAPTDWATRAVHHLDHGVLVQVPGAGHNALATPGVDAIVAAFLDRPLQPPDVSSVAQRPPAPLLAAVHRTSGPLQLNRALGRGQFGALLWPLLSLLILLGAAIVWPKAGRPAALGRSAFALAALLAAAFLLLLTRATLQLLTGEHALAILLGLPAAQSALFLLSDLALAAALFGLIVAGVRQQRRGWSRAAAAHWLLSLTAALSFAAFVIRYDLF